MAVTVIVTYSITIITEMACLFQIGFIMRGPAVILVTRLNMVIGFRRYTESYLE
jgi:hypothetical protein